MPASTSLAEVSTLATNTALSAWGMAGDFLIILILLGVLLLFASYIGRGPFVAVLLAFYAAYALYVAFPYTSLLPTQPPVTALFANIGLYLALVIAFYIILRRVVVSDFLCIGTVGLLLLCLLGSAFLLALAYHVFPVSSLYHFNPALDPFFGPDRYFFWWFIGPAVGLFFFAK